MQCIENLDSPLYLSSSAAADEIGHPTIVRRPCMQKIIMKAQWCILCSRSGQTDGERHHEGETEQKPVRAPAFRKSLDALRRPFSEERPRQVRLLLSHFAIFISPITASEPDLMHARPRFSSAVLCKFQMVHTKLCHPGQMPRATFAHSGRRDSIPIRLQD